MLHKVPVPFLLIAVLAGFGLTSFCWGITWEKTFSGGSNLASSFSSVQQTRDGGYVIGGSTLSFGVGNGDVWVLKLDETGNILWQKTFGGTGFDYATSVQQTRDGGYVVSAGTTSFGGGEDDWWLLKLDPSGNVIWQKTFGGIGFDFLQSVQVTRDGGYVISGSTGSFGRGTDAWLLKLDSSGAIRWQKILGGSNFDQIIALRQTADGGYVSAGSTYSFGEGDSDVWIFKLSASGNVQWQKSMGGKKFDKAVSIEQVRDGGYVVAGRTDSFGAGDSDAWLLKLDGSGNVRWQKTFGGRGPEEAISVHQTIDGGFILADWNFTDTIFLLKLNAEGNIRWRKTLPGTVDSMQLTSDGGYILAGESRFPDRSLLDPMLLKLDAEGKAGNCRLSIPNAKIIITQPGAKPKASSAKLTRTSIVPGPTSAVGKRSTAETDTRCEP